MVVVGGVIAGSQLADRAYKRWWKKYDPMVQYRDRLSEIKADLQERGELVVGVAMIAGIGLLGIAQVISMARERPRPLGPADFVD